MNAEILCACDFASADTHTQKMTIVGTFDTISAASAPCTHDVMHIATKLRFAASEFPSRSIEITIKSDSGEKIMPSMAFQTPPPEQAPNQPNIDSTLTIQVSGMIVGLVLPRFGRYSIELQVDGKILASTPLYVKQSAPSR